MTRVRNEKDFHEKKKQITFDAVDLLSDIGYEEFSLNKVIKRAGLTKGAFFHYFESKDELIDSIVQLLLNPMLEEFDRIAGDDTLSQKEKIHSMFEAGYELKGTDTRQTQQLIMLLVKPENRFMLQMITSRIIAECAPVYERVFKEGNEKGEFSIPHPNGSAYLFINMIAAVNKEVGRVVYKKDVEKKKLEELKSKVDAFEDFARGLLNLEAGERLFSSSILEIELK